VGKRQTAEGGKTNDLPDTYAGRKRALVIKAGSGYGASQTKGAQELVFGLEALNDHRRLRIMPKDAIPDESPLQDGVSVSQRGRVAYVESRYKVNKIFKKYEKKSSINGSMVYKFM
jgi:hypothetical protein